MKYIDANHLKAKIEKRLQENADKALLFGAAFAGRTAEDNEIVNLIASLQQEQPEVDLEKEVEKYLLDNADFVTKSTSNEMVNALARHFAEWGSNHLRDSAKMAPDGMEEAAENIYKTPFGTRAEDFKAGAEWMAERLKR